MNTAFLAPRFAAFALAALVTGGVLAGVDNLAYEQHAAVELARAEAAAAARSAADTTCVVVDRRV